MDREVSPPPVKRRKLSNKAHAAAVPLDPPTPRHISEANGRGSVDTADAIRIFSWNINGISPFLQTRLTNYFAQRRPTADSDDTSPSPPAAPALRAFLRRHHWPHILCLQEIKIAHGDLKTQSAVRRAVNARFDKGDDGPLYEAYFTLPNDKYNARGWGGKLYGVCSIIRSDFLHVNVHQVREVDWDSEGRVSVIEAFGHRGNGVGRLAIYNVYAVNGTNHPYHHPRGGEVIGTRHDRKLAVHRLLMEECARMEADGFGVIIIGDLNIAPERIDGHPNLRTFPGQHGLNRADFKTRFLSGEAEGTFAGVDVWRAMRGDAKRYTYYPRGLPWGSSCDRIDLVIASKKMVDDGSIVGVEILNTEKERGPSDHVPISVDIKFKT